MLSAIWWTAFTLAGIWCQGLLPGIDCLAPGLVISLYDENTPTTITLAAIWIILQEGMGTLAFGYAAIWYSLLVLFFLFTHKLFKPKSLLFICLAGGFLAVLKVILTLSLLSLESKSLPLGKVFLDSLFQAASFPAIWFAAHELYPNRLKKNERFL